MGSIDLTIDYMVQYNRRRGMIIYERRMVREKNKKKSHCFASIVLLFIYPISLPIFGIPTPQLPGLSRKSQIKSH